MYLTNTHGQGREPDLVLIPVSDLCGFPASKIRIILGPPEVAVTVKRNNACPNTQQMIGFNYKIIIDILY